MRLLPEDALVSLPEYYYAYTIKTETPNMHFYWVVGGGIIVLLSSLLIYIYGETIIGNTILFFALAYFPLLLICILKSKIIYVIFSSKPLIILGELSYDIFLYHFPMQLVFVIFYNLHIFKGFHLYRIETLGLWIMSTILIAFISKKCVDKRIGCLFDYFLQVFDLKP